MKDVVCWVNSIFPIWEWYVFCCYLFEFSGLFSRAWRTFVRCQFSNQLVSIISFRILALCKCFLALTVLLDLRVFAQACFRLGTRLSMQFKRNGGFTLKSLFLDSTILLRLKSFDHLYNSWKNGKRNSFYLCGPNFTVLFIKIFKPSDNSFDPEDTCMGFNDSLEHRVIITPTTCGFRKLLKSNGLWI